MQTGRSVYEEGGGGQCDTMHAGMRLWRHTSALYLLGLYRGTMYLYSRTEVHAAPFGAIVRSLPARVTGLSLTA